MNVAVLGGRFDPPHIWHFWSAQQVLENVSGIDQVWYLPDYKNAFKPIEASSSDRLSMLKFMETGRIKTSTAATEDQTITYTVTVIRKLIEEGNNRYFFIVGSDILNEFHKWRDFRKLTNIVNFLVFPRKDFPIKNLPAGFGRIEGNIMMSNVSSTIIRERIKKGLTVSGLIFQEVENYIRQKNLYK